MNNKVSTLFAILLFLSTFTFAQTAMKEFKAGHIFTISLPDYMSKTTGINSSSTIQFKNAIKDVYGFVIEDSKEELHMLEMNYSSLTEFYDDFIKDFLKDEEKRNLSKPVYKKIGTTNFVENDISYFDKDANTEIYYFVGLVETSTTYYKVLCWVTLENKEKFKSDFEKILYSIKD